MKPLTVDELLLKFGDPGKYQAATYCMLWLSICVTAFNSFLIFFVVGYYPHHCKLPDEWDWPLNESIPLNEDGEMESCSMYKNPGNQSEGTTSCQYGWTHLTPGTQWTIVQEWDLVCSSRHLGAVSITLYYLGVMVGSILFGYLSDKIGRKPVILTGLYVHIVCAVAVAYSTSFTMYIGLRMVHGAFLQGIVGTAIVMTIEIVQPHHRNFIAITNQILWPLILFTVTSFSYVFGHWRTLHLIGGIPTIFTIAYIWLLPESVRWLLVFQKLPQAYEILRKTARFNRIRVPVDLETEIKSVSDNIQATKKSVKKVNEFKELLKTSKSRQIVASACYMWFATSFVYWGISYSMPKFGSSNHITFLISSSIEFSLNIILMYWIMQRFGRRGICMTIMSVCATVNILAAILRNTLPVNESWANIILGLVAISGRISLSVYFACMPMFFRELYPTNVRTIANGVAQIVSRPASMVAPYFIMLEQEVWKPLPFLIYSVFCVGTIVVTYLLPETFNKPLPEIPEDLEKLWESKKSQTKWWRRSAENKKKKTANQKEEATELQKPEPEETVSGLNED